MVAAYTKRAEWLYDATNSINTELDESDLIIFRLLGVEFKYSEVVFED